MRMMKYLTLYACVVASPAAANWQYTRWGMTPDEVIAASGGAATAGSGERSVQGDQIKGAVGSYISGTYRFGLTFWFGESGLSTVSLGLDDDAQCLLVHRDLLARYGEPVEQSGRAVGRTMWADREGGNRVTMILTGLGFCELQYAPLASSNAQGL